MKITVKKLGTFISILGILTSLVMINGNLLFHTSFSYIAITVGFLCGFILLKLCTRKN